MRYLFIVFFLFLSSSLMGNELNFSYEYTHNPRSFNLELYELSKIFEERGFQRLTSSPMGNIPLVHADEVMSSPYHKGSIFIKMDLKAPKDLHYRVMTGKGFYLYHTKNASLAFFDFSREEVAELTKKLTPSFFSRFNLQDFVMGKAYADEIHCKENSANAFSEIENIGQNLSLTLLYKKLGECGVSALRGIEKKTDSTFDFFSKLKNNPLKLWEEMKVSYEKLKHFIMNISTELRSFYDSVQGLSIDDMLEIGCNMIGEAVPSLGLVVTGVGAVAGTTRIMAMLVPKLQKLRTLLVTAKNRKALSVKEAISCGL